MPLYEAITPREMTASGHEQTDRRHTFTMFTASPFPSVRRAKLSDAGTANVTRNTIHRFLLLDWGPEPVIRAVERSRFTEGFDMLDLKVAKALLDESGS